MAAYESKGLTNGGFDPTAETTGVGGPQEDRFCVSVIYCRRHRRRNRRVKDGGQIEGESKVVGPIAKCDSVLMSLSDALTGGGDVSCVGQTVKPARRRCSVAVGDAYRGRYNLRLLCFWVSPPAAVGYNYVRENEVYEIRWFLGPRPVLVDSGVQEEGCHLLLKP
uniref:Uncharacterized protein n=1 Tax=Vitis vinifera TaxID=29760 RepID=A5AHG9_VITVI|nr:hypothetical protein VITISV_019031 [Vitis vinifera]